MKFCTTCNKELDDNAAFCVACGAPQPAPAPVAAPAPVVAPVAETAPAPQKETNGLISLFAFIGDLMAIVSTFFMIAAVAASNLYINVYISKYTSGLNSYGRIETNAGCAILGFLLSLGVIATGVLSLIFAIKNHEGKAGLFKSIKKLTIGFFLFILGIILMAHI
jgi:hypothetical protein